MERPSSATIEFEFERACFVLAEFCKARGGHDTLALREPGYVAHAVEFGGINISIAVTNRDNDAFIDFYTTIMPESAIRSAKVFRALLRFNASLTSSTVCVYEANVTLSHSFSLMSCPLTNDVILGALTRLAGYADDIKHWIFSRELREHVFGTMELPLAN